FHQFIVKGRSVVSEQFQGTTMMMDEEELLNVPDDQQHISDEVFDVDELLGPSDGSKDEVTDLLDTGGTVSDCAGEVS
uniref:RNA recognition motif domain containing protein n=1 Tax=Haemonchus contortus TaxID=6289 RepID=A0A7I4YDP1_HAECO